MRSLLPLAVQALQLVQLPAVRCSYPQPFTGNEEALQKGGTTMKKGSNPGPPGPPKPGAKETPEEMKVRLLERISGLASDKSELGISWHLYVEQAHQLARIADALETLVSFGLGK